MAELGLAVAGVSATAGTLSKSLYGLYHSARDACKEAETVAVELKLLRAVLRELRSTLQRRHVNCSENAKNTILQLLAACRGIFKSIEQTIQPLVRTANPQRKHLALRKRLSWHFKKDNIQLLIGHLNSFKTTISLMVSIMSLGGTLSQTTFSSSTPGKVSSQLRTNLSIASERVLDQRVCLANLARIEQQIIRSSPVSQEVQSLRSARTSVWLDHVVGLDSGPSLVISATNSTGSSGLLSDEQRSIVGTRSSDVENLLERWTTLSELHPPSSVVSCFSPVSPEQKDCIPEQISEDVSDGDSWSTISETEESTNTDELRNVVKQPMEAADTDAEMVQDRHSTNSSFGMIARSGGTKPSMSFKRLAITVTDSCRSSESLAGETVKEVQSTDVDRMPKHSVLEEGGQTPIPTPGVPRGDEFSDLDNDSRQWSNVSAVEQWLQQRDSSIISQRSNAPNITNQHILSGLDVGGSTLSLASLAISSISSVSTDSVPKAEKLMRGAKSLKKLGQRKQSLLLYLKAYKQRDELDLQGLSDLFFNIGVLLIDHDQLEKSESMLRKALSTQKLLKCNPRTTLTTQHILARVLSSQTKWKEAERVYRDITEQFKKDAKEHSTTHKVVQISVEYSTTLLKMEQFEDVVNLLEPIMSEAREHASTDLSQLHNQLNFNLAKSYRHTERSSEAKSMFERLLSNNEDRHTPDLALLANCNQELAIIEYADQNFAEARRLAKLVIAHSSGLDNETARRNDDFVQSRRFLGMAEMKLGNLREADKVFSRSRPILLRVLGSKHSHVIETTIHHADVLSDMDQPRAAERILDRAFTDTFNHGEGPNSVDHHVMQVAQKLGPLLIQNSAPDAQRKRGHNFQLIQYLPAGKLNRAMLVYSVLYNGQKSKLGYNSEEFLQTSHDYGCLCSVTKEYLQAEKILRETWNERKRLLGESHELSTQTGLQLGLVLFQRKKQAEAISMFTSVYDVRRDLSGMQSVDTIRCAEMLGLCRLADQRTKPEIRDQGLQLLEGAVEARQQMSGASISTYKAAFRLALIASSKGDLIKSQQWYFWIFQLGGQHPRLQVGSPPVRELSSMLAGLSSSMLAYVNESRVYGNQVLQQVVQRSRITYGDAHEISHQLAYMQATLLFMQREGRSTTDVLRQVYDERRRAFGRRRKSTKAAGNLLALGLIADAVLCGRAIPAEASRVHDAISPASGSQTLIMNTCSGIGLILASLNLHNFAIPLLRWVYQVEKKRSGRFSYSTLRTLAILHAFTGRKLFQKVRRKESEIPNQHDPRAWLDDIWGKLVKAIKVTAKGANHGSPLATSLSRLIPKAFAKNALWKSFESEMGSLAGIGAGPFEHELDLNNLRDVLFANSFDEKDNTSRVWTIFSDEESEDSKFSATGRQARRRQTRSIAPSREGHYFSDDYEDDASIDLSDIMGSELSEHLSALSGSIIDLTALSDLEIQKADDRIQEVESRLVHDILGDIDLESVRSRAVHIEQEAGVGGD